MSIFNSKAAAIKCHLRGGLGNQLFIYAFNYALAKRCNARLCCDTQSGFSSDFFKRLPNIRHFNVEYEEWDSGFSYNTFRVISKFNIIKSTINRNVFSFLFETVKPHEFQDIKFEARCLVGKCKFTYGYWQNERYFSPYEEAIRKMFTIKTAISGESKIVESKIRAGLSVCVHFRRKHGIPAGSNLTNNQITPLPKEYYYHSLKLIKLKSRSFNIFCFGDDLSFAKEIFKNYNNVEYVAHNGSEDRSFEDFYLMSLCDNQIISNSTFSWWAAWLARSPHKVVVSPDPNEYFGVPSPADSWNIIRKNEYL